MSPYLSDISLPVSTGSNRRFFLTYSLVQNQPAEHYFTYIHALLEQRFICLTL